MKYSLGYLTAPTKGEAKQIVLTLLQEGLIACGNIMPPHEAYYLWEEEIEQASEVSIIIKTKPTHHARIIRLVKEIHSYDCPCIVFMPIEDANPAFLDWLDASIG